MLDPLNWQIDWFKINIEIKTRAGQKAKKFPTFSRLKNALHVAPQLVNELRTVDVFAVAFTT